MPEGLGGGSYTTGLRHVKVPFPCVVVGTSEHTLQHPTQFLSANGNYTTHNFRKDREVIDVRQDSNPRLLF